jgi:hypothetical protein
MGDCPKKYLKFNDVTEEYKNQFENDTTSEFYCASNSSWGQKVSEENFKELESAKMNSILNLDVLKGEIGHYFQKGKNYRCYFTKEHKYPKKHIWIKVENIIETSHPDEDTCFEGKIQVIKINKPKQIKLKDRYNNNFEFFMKDYAGYEKNNKGQYGYWENPNAKWDWYQLGDRWCGFFKLKENSESGKIGDPSLLMKNFEKKKNTADQAFKKDIDFKAMYKESELKAEDRYKMVENLFSKYLNCKIPKIKISWETLLNDKKYKGWSIDRKRKFYHNQSALKKFRELNKILNKSKEKFNKNQKDFIIWGDLSDYQTDLKIYIQKQKEKAIVTFAIIKDRKWYEKGEMGWWNTVSNEKDENKWNKEFNKLLDSINDETLLSIYDCHI